MSINYRDYAPFVEPIAVLILVILVAVVAGGVAFLMGYRAQQQQEFRETRTPDSATRRD